LKSGRLPNRSRVLTFVLDGRATLPPAVDAQPELPPPPAAAQAPERAAEGSIVFARYCGSCHGDAAYSGGILPDLRYSRALADDGLWQAVVFKGALSANDMICFESALGVARLAAVRAYLIARAQEGYAAERRGAAVTH
jgi:quinohemoprotein ethanol dehydrogenase